MEIPHKSEACNNKNQRRILFHHHLVNPLQSRCSFSESDIQKLLPCGNKSSGNNGNSVLNNTNQTPTDEENGSSSTHICGKITTSISATIKENKLALTIRSQRQLAELVFVVFIEIFYKAAKSHFLCPICNDYLREPKMLPSCGHMFCSNCLAFWFSNSPLRSCPVCRSYTSAAQNVSTPIRTVGTFIERVEKLKGFFSPHQTSQQQQQQQHTVRQKMKELLSILGLPQTEKNCVLLLQKLSRADESPTFQSPSLERMHRHWTFQQLLYNLRFAQRQTINQQSFLAHFSRATWATKVKEQTLDMLRMICPFYGLVAQTGLYVSLIRSGRLRVVFQRPNVDQVCMMFIALMLAVLIYMVFTFFIQRGMKRQLKLLIHFTVILMINDYMEPL